jgi:hypothetical protein
MISRARDFDEDLGIEPSPVKTRTAPKPLRPRPPKRSPTKPGEGPEDLAPNSAPSRDWYVVHTYSGMENASSRNIAPR